MTAFDAPTPDPATDAAAHDGVATPARALPVARAPEGIPADAVGKVNLLDMTPAEAERALREFATANGEPAYRATQVLPRLWQRPVASFEAIAELPAAFRAKLAERFALPRLTLVAHQRSSDGTRKFLFRLADGQAIETVAIPDRDRLTFCISSQAGCALKCSFCATGVMGFQRNLHVFEIAGQVRELALLDEEPLRPTNIVFMGMGEPLMNWKSVAPTLTILNDPKGCGIGARHITISTVGILPGIVALGERPEQFRLAISVHAPTDALRQELMPVNTKYPACRRHRRRRDVRAAGDVRVRHARWRERPRGARDRAGEAREAVPRVREPHPAAPRRRARLHADAQGRDRAIRASGCARAASRSRSGRAAASTSPRRAGSYGWNGSVGAVPAAADEDRDVQIA